MVEGVVWKLAVVPVSAEWESNWSPRLAPEESKNVRISSLPPILKTIMDIKNIISSHSYYSDMRNHNR